MPRSWVCALSLLALACGCMENLGARQEVRGTVKLKGVPLDQGIIEFHPLSRGSGEVTKSGAPITNGAYKIDRIDGLVPGKYRVILTAGDGRTPITDPDGVPGPTGANIVSVDRIPAEYNVESKQEVEIKSGQPNVFDYIIP